MANEFTLISMCNGNFTRRLKYSCMMSIDGNFHLQRNHKGTRKDSPLSGNAGFWVDDGELADYIDAKGARVENQEWVRTFFSSSLWL